MKRFNFDEFMWFIILILLDLSIIDLVSTGKISFYIGSNVVKYMYFTIIVMSIIAISQIKNIFTSKGNSSSIKLKIIPIVFALILGAISVDNLKTFKHSELDKEIRENNVSRIERRSLYEYEFDYKLNGDKNNINAENSQQNTIIVDENNPMTLEYIRINPEKYVGKKLEIHGFICKENYLNKNQFIIGRIVMTCCAADSRVVGIVGEYENANDLNESENVKVIGRIGSSTLKDENNVNHKIPIIVVEKIENEE
ncbi:MULTISPECIES: TIGR03943 family protein [unclassified Clostridium]|uniref:TIGR03943 family putative permease subunit n=1 Tax=unclassified Clostridium TaxID=2614128 RepID=UPI000297A137|nr:MULTISPECIES: TIGR03943 family protein [unclassified Clostridium]EKQ57079.1 MAG: TIGR03943 family protein [Clostridium sp. Maddingley MBC34-26]